MDGAALTRLHWRLRGAWMWPSLIALTLAEGPLTHFLSPFGTHAWSLAAGWLVSFILNLIAIVVGAPVLGWALRRVRRDLPRLIARDYAGAGVCLALAAWLLASGLANRATIASYRFALRDATARAEAYIGDHAPAPFMTRLGHLDTYALAPPEVYRTCVSSAPGGRDGGRDWCVVVDRSKPFGEGVRYAGSEPNALLDAGAG